MSQKVFEEITFQVTVNELVLSSELPEHLRDVRVTVGIGDVTKITCPGIFSEDDQKITWNHPFLFTASPSTSVVISICVLPEELAPDWNKVPVGDQMVTHVADLLESSNGWKCNVLGLHHGSATLFMTCRACVVLNVPDDHDCVPNLWDYDIRLYAFSEQLENIPAVATQIEIEQAILDLCPADSELHISILRNLALSFLTQYHTLGNISDLNRNVETIQKVLYLCSSNDPEYTHALGTYATSLWKSYWVQGNMVDLNMAIEVGEKRLELCPSDHPDHMTALVNLAPYLENRYREEENMIDLNRAIELLQKALNLCSPDHQDDIATGNLAIALQQRYRRNKNLVDLETAIGLNEKLLALQPLGHPNHAYALQDFGNLLMDHYRATGTHSDLARATDLFNKSIAACPTSQHPYFALGVDNLAIAILLQYKSLSQPHILEEAFNTYRLLGDCGPTISINLWNATQAWIRNAEEYKHPSSLEAYQTSLNTLDYSISIQASVDSRHEAAQAKVASLANDAFSCAVRNGDLKMAVELLERGRGILWSQLARFDAPLAALESLGNEGYMLAIKFTQLSTSLKKHTQGRGGNGMDSYWRIYEEWQSVINKIRRQDGFSRFLLPPHFDDIQQAAECGPVIIVNASKYTCDALIVLRNLPLVRIPLNCSLSDVDDLCLQFSELTRDPHAYGTNRESWIKQSLRELWSSVVEPIVTVLQNDVQLSTGSRIWWYPTSRFTILPFHAAGPYRKTRKNLMDIYVSSYAPSLSALIRAREKAYSQRKARGTSGTANTISFAAIGQARPDAALNLPDLPEVRHEIQRVQNEIGEVQNVSFDTITGDAATIEGAVQAFRDHRWVHIACHGAQHATKPFESWFAMGDGKLTLMRIIRERYTQSEFAFLSACHTAVGDESTPDEVIHLAAGMQFAGFNGVIGTLWRVDDSIAHQVVTRFYRKMFEQPDIDSEHAATALNGAVLELADDIPLESRVVFVHIGI